MTSTTPLSGTVVTTYTFDAANRLTDRIVSDGRTYTYTWSPRGEMLAEWTQGYPVRTFTYDAAGRMVEATVFTLTTRFTYNGDGDRLVVNVVGQGATTYTLDYATGGRILSEETITGTTLYLYPLAGIGGQDCLGEQRDGEWLYYLYDATRHVRQGVDEQGEVVSVWLFDPDGVLLEGPEGPVSHLICGDVYDWSTGLIYQGGRYFDPLLGIWLTLTPLIVWQAFVLQDRRRRKIPPWLACFVLVSISLVSCGGEDQGPAPTPTCTTIPSGALGKVEVNVVHLHGVTRDYQADVDYANDVLNPAGIQVSAYLKETIDRSETKAILRDDQLLDAGPVYILDVSELPPNLETCRLTTGDDCEDLNYNTGEVTPEHLLTLTPRVPRYDDGRITMYYVPGFKQVNLQGITWTFFEKYWQKPANFAVAAYKQVPKRTWVHELGHVLGIRSNDMMHESVPYSNFMSWNLPATDPYAPHQRGVAQVSALQNEVMMRSQYLIHP